MRHAKNFFFLLVVGFCWVGQPSPGLTLDEEGCLTCHRYPGLVRHEKHDGFKVLHIDETTFYQSVHGRFKCRRCHPTIAKVPHTGENRVDCTSRCHHRDGDGGILPEDYPLDGFHQNEQSFISRIADNTSCRVCHPLYSHSHDTVVRAFLNMHTGFMLCEVCHIKRGKYGRLAYDWHAGESVQFKGPPFGTYFHPKTVSGDDPEHTIIRMAAYEKKNGKYRPLANTLDTGKAAQYQRDQGKLGTEEKKEAMAYFHRDIEKRQISVACEECHASNSIMNFKQLGFNERKTKQLTSLNLKGLVTKYDIFYLPKLFDD